MQCWKKERERVQFRCKGGLWAQNSPNWTLQDSLQDLCSYQRQDAMLCSAFFLERENSKARNAISRQHWKYFDISLFEYVLRSTKKKGWVILPTIICWQGIIENRLSHPKIITFQILPKTINQGWGSKLQTKFHVDILSGFDLCIKFWLEHKGN